MCPVHTATAPLHAEQCGAKCILFLCTATELWCIIMNEMYLYKELFTIIFGSRKTEQFSFTCHWVRTFKYFVLRRYYRWVCQKKLEVKNCREFLTTIIFKRHFLHYRVFSVCTIKASYFQCSRVWRYVFNWFIVAVIDKGREWWCVCVCVCVCMWGGAALKDPALGRQRE